jgi:alpha-ribazole phosphatase
MARRLAITFLRHGLTTENQEKRYIGWTNSLLSEEGRNSLNEKMDDYPIPDSIICSDLMRCRETYEILYGTKRSIPVEFSKSWRECSFGSWERKTHAELVDNDDYQKWLTNWNVAQIPNGESYPTFKRRILYGWQELTSQFLDKKMNHVVIITHGGPIRTVLSLFAPMEKSFWEWNVSHGEGFHLETTEQRLRGNKRCISLQAVPFKERGNG